MPKNRDLKPAEFKAISKCVASGNISKLWMIGKIINAALQGAGEKPSPRARSDYGSNKLKAYSDSLMKNGVKISPKDLEGYARFARRWTQAEAKNVDKFVHVKWRHMYALLTLDSHIEQLEGDLATSFGEAEIKLREQIKVLEKARRDLPKEIDEKKLNSDQVRKRVTAIIKSENIGMPAKLKKARLVSARDDVDRSLAIAARKLAVAADLFPKITIAGPVAAPALKYAKEITRLQGLAAQLFVNAIAEIDNDINPRLSTKDDIEL